MGKADLHIHTTFSDGTCTVEVALEWAANYTGLDVVAITDHDTLYGAWKAQEISHNYGIEVIPGCEVTTRDGHMLALFLHTPIPRGLSMLESVLRVGEQGGLCLPAHPTDFLAHGVSREVLEQVLRHADARRVLIGIEAINTGIFNQKANRNAGQMAADFGLAPTGNSDSHVFWTIGLGYTVFEGHTAEDVRKALLAGKTSAQRVSPGRSPAYWPRHVMSFMLRKAGWVTWTQEPNAGFELRRLADIQARSL